MKTQRIKPKHSVDNRRRARAIDRLSIGLRKQVYPYPTESRILYEKLDDCC